MVINYRLHYAFHIVFCGINEDNSDGKSEDFPIVKNDTVSLGLFESSMLGQADPKKFGEDIGFKEGVLLVNMSDIMKVSL